MSSETMLPCKKVTRERLRAMGKKGETYDDILNKLIDTFEKCADSVTPTAT